MPDDDVLTATVQALLRRNRAARESWNERTSRLLHAMLTGEDPYVAAFPDETTVPGEDADTRGESPADGTVDGGDRQ